MRKTKTLFLLMSLVLVYTFGFILDDPFGSKTPISYTKQAQSNPVHVSYGTPIFTDNFDGANDTTALRARGYLIYQNSIPRGSTFWFQGNNTVFNAYNGPTTGYVGANYNATGSIGQIDVWMVTPKVVGGIQAGDSLFFYARSTDLASTNYPDSIRVMHSVSDSTVGGAWSELGRFKVPNPPAGSGTWTKFGFRAPTTSTNGRFAIRYNVVGGGSTGANSDYIGIDALTIERSSTPPPTLTWQSVIKCNDAGTGNDSLYFGTAPTATNGLDPSLGETELPPVPPTSIFDYRFVLPVTPSVASKKDYRADGQQAITWRMTFQPSSSGYPLTFNWNPSSLPVGSFFLKDEVTGTIVSVNMKSQNSYTLTNSGITSLKIEYSQFSPPVLLSPANNSIGVSLTPLLDWSDVNSAVSYGVQVATDSSFLNIVYNNQSVTNSHITVQPALNGNTVYFWRVNASNGTITSAYSLPWRFQTTCPVTWQSLIKCTDLGLVKDSLYFGTAPSATNGLDLCLGELELPPVPPSSVFDYRFVFPTTPAIPSKKDFRSNTNLTITWRMSFQPSASGYPMTFNWNSSSLPPGNFYLKDDITGTLVNINMKSQNSYILTNTGITTLKIEYSQCSVTWEAFVKLTDNGGSNDSSSIGTSSSGTIGLDPCLGEYELPPAPPSGVFDSRLVLPLSPPIETDRDIRNDTSNFITWKMKFQPGSGGYPFIINWNSSALPEGSFRLKDEITGTLVNVNMKTQNSFTLTNSGITTLKIEYQDVIESNLTFNQGWNLFSVPIFSPDMSVTALFPGGPAQAFSYNGSYTAVTSLSNGFGYWIKFDSSENYSIFGTEVTNRTINVSSGWNMIGCFNNNLSVSQIVSNPPGIVNSNYFYYSNQYFIASQINPGKGYWVKTSQAGTLTIPVTTDILITEDDSESELNSMIKFTFTDKSGLKAQLYLSDKLNENKSYELPPIAPALVFDARFSSGRYAESTGKNNTIKLTSASYPISLKVENVGAHNLKLKDGLTGSLLDVELKEGYTITIPDNVDNLVLSDINNLVPNVYNLSQNYPNPFNPTTTINYQLPQEGIVTLKVFDILGREIITLVNNHQQAGYYSVKFDASGLSSGVYFYKMQAGYFQSVKKLIITK